MKRFVHTILGVVCVLLLVSLAIGVGAVLFVRQAASRIVISQQAANSAIHESIALTFDNGSVEQKLQTMAALRQTGIAAKPYIPALILLTRDNNPEVREAAIDSIQQIDPTAIIPDAMR
jgi:HEAT repeat protein